MYYYSNWGTSILCVSLYHYLLKQLYTINVLTIYKEVENHIGHSKIKIEEKMTTQAKKGETG